MQLDKLELKGFKSFRDKTILEFPSSFSAIVGPNGSGKSNLTEAICFVLGKSRGLRAGNLQELIFNGGKKDKPAGKAVVRIQLTDENKSRVEISRTVDREGHSIYKLNGERVIRQRIIDLVGDNEYNILLQDDVTRVIDMKSKERRAMIDELCGIYEYDKKKEKALKELEKVDDRISETNIILGEKQGYMRELKGERDQALEFQSLRDELMRCEASVLHKNIVSLEKRMEKLDETIRELSGEKNGLLEAVQKNRGQVVSYNQRIKEINDGIIKLEGGKGGVRAAGIQGEIVGNEDMLSLLKSRVEFAGAEIIRKGGEHERLAVENERIKEELGGVFEERKKVDVDVKEELVESSEKKIDESIDEVKDRVYDLKSQEGTLLNITKDNEKRMGELSGYEKNLENELKKLSDEKKIKSTEISSQKKKINSISDEIQTLESKNKNDSLTLDETHEKLETERNILAQKKARLDALERAGGGVQGAVRAVMNLKKVVPGIYGTVPQIGVVSKPEYEMPLMIAAGGRIHNIVVDDIETAEKCIDYLRKKKIGRATFLPLDKINVKCENRPPKEAIGFARDFINTEKKFEKIFEYVFRDTILVEDVKTANHVGVGRWRMVTLDGSLLEASGAVSGGYADKNIEIVFSNLDELEKEIKNLEALVSDLTVKKDELTLECNQTKDKIKDLNNRMLNLKDELKNPEIELQLAAERENELKNRIRSTREDKSRLDDENKRCKEKLEKIRAESKSLKDKLDDLVKKRGEKEATKLDELKDRLRDLEVNESKLGERLSINIEQQEELKKDIKALAEEKKKTEKEIEETEDKLSKLTSELKLREKEDSKLLDEIEKLDKMRSDVDARLVEIGEETGAHERRLLEVDESISNAGIEKAKTETHLEDLRKDYERYSGVELVEKSMKELKDSIDELEVKLSGFGSVNMRAIETYEVVKKEYDEISAKLKTLQSEKQSIFDFMDSVEKKRYKAFMEAFNVVKKNFEEIFAKLSNGKGTLVLDNPGNISESGLLIKASPEGKKVMSLDSMSGGEKVLTSSAFLLAMQQYKPSHFYLIDELDAALDKKNSTRLAEMLKNSGSQFILVTHNDTIIKQVDTVVGVSMVDGVSQIVGVKLT